MCHSDITPIVWTWSDPHDGRAPFNGGHVNTIHTCRNFDKIWQWAKESEMNGEFDINVPYEDPKLDIPIWP